eukprot:11213919-Ditylum_brightwellii.AAC.1
MRVLQKPSPQVDTSPKGRGMKSKEGEDSTMPWTGGETSNKKKVPLAARSSKQGKGRTRKKLTVNYPKPKLKTTHTQNISTFVDSFVVEKVDGNKGKKGDKKKEDSSKEKKGEKKKERHASADEKADKKMMQEKKMSLMWWHRSSEEYFCSMQSSSF